MALEWGVRPVSPLVGARSRARATVVTCLWKEEDYEQSARAAMSWHEFFVVNQKVAHLRDVLEALDFAMLVHRVKAERVAVLAILKGAGVNKLSDRQALASALSRHTKLAAAAAAAFTPASKLHVKLVVTINVHELPSFMAAGQCRGPSALGRGHHWPIPAAG